MNQIESFIATSFLVDNFPAYYANHYAKCFCLYANQLCQKLCWHNKLKSMPKPATNTTIDPKYIENILCYEVVSFECSKSVSSWATSTAILTVKHLSLNSYVHP